MPVRSFIRLFSISVWGLIVFFAACTSEEPETISCVTAFDCPIDWFCEDNVCVEFPDSETPLDKDAVAKDADTDTDTDNDADAVTDTAGDADRADDGADGADSGADPDVPTDDGGVGDGDDPLQDADDIASDDDTLLTEEDHEPSDDGTVATDDGAIVTDDAVVTPDDGAVVTDDAVVPDNDIPVPCGNGQNTVPDGLKLYLRMDESGGSTAYDSSAGPVNGTFTAGASLGHTGSRGKAIAFNQDSNFQVPDTAKLDLAGTMSVVAWVNLPDNGAGNTRPYLVVGKGSGHQANFAMFREANRTISFIFHNWIVDGIVCGASSTTNPIDDGAWHHVAGTYDGTYTRIYIDGVLETTSDPCIITPIVNDHPVTIGQVAPAFLYTDPYTGTGYIDEVRIYDRALSLGDILSLKDGPHEYCDDGNHTDGDGCNSVCEVEPNWNCGGMPSTCQFEVTFNYTGVTQEWVVPVGVTSVTIEAWGGQGRSNGAGTVAGGLGGYAKATVPVTPGQTLYINVGQGGGSGSAGGWNGGGIGGIGGVSTANGGGGGGGTDVRRGGAALTDRVIVAGGGSGAGGNRIEGSSPGAGGGGGGGYYGGGGGGAWAPSVMAGGGTQTAGGNGGSGGAGGGAGTAGSLGTGGNGENAASSNQSDSNTASGGVAGGGETGANGTCSGNWTGGSGGGGSGYTAAPGNTGTTMNSGVRAGDGLVIITL